VLPAICSTVAAAAEGPEGADKTTAPTRLARGAFRSPNLGGAEIGVWRQSAPEGLAQFGLALTFADPGVGQQAGIQARQLAAADHAALPQAEGGKYAQRHCAGRGVAVIEKQVGTEGTFHGGHPSACGGSG